VRAGKPKHPTLFRKKLFELGEGIGSGKEALMARLRALRPLFARGVDG
jgi:hypothetical protein